MHYLIDLVGNLLQEAIDLVVFVYVPFARSWRRAWICVLAVSCAWSAVRIVAITKFREEMPPMMGFFVFPLFAVAYAGIARMVKMLLFKIPFLSRLEQRFLSRFSTREKRA